MVYDILTKIVMRIGYGFGFGLGMAVAFNIIPRKTIIINDKQQYVPPNITK